MNWKPTGATRPLAAALAVMFAAACSDTEPTAPPISADGITPVFTFASVVCNATVEDGESIQDAIDAADPGDTICVETGTYPGNLTVAKQDLTLLGPNHGIPGDDAASRGAEAVIEGKFVRMQSPADGFVLDGFRIETDGRAVYADNIATIRNNVLLGKQPATETFQSGVFSGTTRSLVVEDNLIEGFDRGVTLDGGPGSIASTFERNLITGVSTGISTFASLFLGTGHVIRDNVIDGNSGTGIRLAGRAVTSTVEGTTFTIEGNEITNNSSGIVAGVGTTHSAAELVATGNIIVGNSSVGVANVGPGDAFNATCNWWGAVDGPGGDGPGNGDAVSGEVEFTPWSVTPDAEEPCDGGLAPTDPQTIQDCMGGGWEAFGFRNQGLCIQFVNTGRDSR